MAQATPIYDSVLFSSLITSVVTVFVGLIAFIIYQKQQNDKKKDAATIILLEIQNAEKQLVPAKESILRDGVIKEDIFLMPTHHWEDYKYLFVREFNSRELSDISYFFKQCNSYDGIVKYSNSFFVKNEEQIRKNLQSVLAD